MLVVVAAELAKTFLRLAAAQVAQAVVAMVLATQLAGQARLTPVAAAVARVIAAVPQAAQAVPAS